MVEIEQYGEIIEKILQRYAALPYRYGEVDTFVVVDRDRRHFLLMDEGWQDGLRVHGLIVHAQIRDRKIWIHRDGIEEGITPELLEAGIPKERIVLAFYPADHRQYTEFAVS